MASLLLACGIVDASETAPARAIKAPAAPYSLPWQLRPMVAVSVFRFDDTLSVYRNPANGDRGITNTTMLLGSYRVWRSLTVLARLGVVANRPPTPAMDPSMAPQSGAAFLNPALGAYYGLKLPRGFWITPFLAVTLPVGMGGGDTPDPGQKTARNAGILNRSAMDNAMFAVNDLTLFPGIGAAWVGKGLTVQIEATFLQLIRVRGALDQPDSFKSNMTLGLHLGYFFIPQLSLGTEVRYQRWLLAPQAVERDATGTLVDNVTLAVGLRAHFKTRHAVLRPGIAYAHGLDQPMWAQDHHIIQFDVPVVFR